MRCAEIKSVKKFYKSYSDSRALISAPCDMESLQIECDWFIQEHGGKDVVGADEPYFFEEFAVIGDGTEIKGMNHGFV